MKMYNIFARVCAMRVLKLAERERKRRDCVCAKASMFHVHIDTVLSLRP